MRKNLRSERALGMIASEWLREVIRMRTADVSIISLWKVMKKFNGGINARFLAYVNGSSNILRSCHSLTFVPFSAVNLYP